MTEALPQQQQQGFAPPDFNKMYFYPSCTSTAGITLDDQLREQSRLNSSFAQNNWTNAQLSGCLPKACQPLPNWPPPAGTGFIYPTLEKKQQELLDLGIATGCSETYALQPPYSQTGVPPTINLSQQPMDLTNPVQCPPTNLAAVSDMSALHEKIPRGTDPYLAARLASSMLNIPMDQLLARRSVNADAGPIKHSESDPDPVPAPAPSPNPYDDPKCELNNADFSLKEVLPCTLNSLKGIFYDFKHWKELPVSSTPSKLKYVFTRDDRIFYLVVVISAILLTIIMLKALFGSSKNKTEVIYAQP